MRKLTLRFWAVNISVILLAIYGMALIFFLDLSQSTFGILFPSALLGCLVGVLFPAAVPKKNMLMYVRVMNKSATKTETDTTRMQASIAVAGGYFIRYVLTLLVPEASVSKQVAFLGFLLISLTVYQVIFASRNIDEIVSTNLSAKPSG